MFEDLLVCFVVTFSSFASWSVPRSMPDQIDHIYIAAVAQPHCWFPKLIKLLFPQNVAQVGCNECPENSFVGMLKIYINVFRFFFRLWETSTVELVTFEKFGGDETLTRTKDGYGGSSNAFRSRSSGTRMECACRISDPKMRNMPKSWKKSWELSWKYCRALVG